MNLHYSVFIIKGREPNKMLAKAGFGFELIPRCLIQVDLNSVDVWVIWNETWMSNLCRHKIIAVAVSYKFGSSTSINGKARLHMAHMQ